MSPALRQVKSALSASLESETVWIDTFFQRQNMASFPLDFNIDHPNIFGPLISLRAPLFTWFFKYQFDTIYYTFLKTERSGEYNAALNHLVTTIIVWHLKWHLFTKQKVQGVPRYPWKLAWTTLTPSWPPQSPLTKPLKPLTFKTSVLHHKWFLSKNTKTNWSKVAPM